MFHAEATSSIDQSGPKETTKPKGSWRAGPVSDPTFEANSGDNGVKSASGVGDAGGGGCDDCNIRQIAEKYGYSVVQLAKFFQDHPIIEINNENFNTVFFSNLNDPEYSMLYNLKFSPPNVKSENVITKVTDFISDIQKFVKRRVNPISVGMTYQGLNINQPKLDISIIESPSLKGQLIDNYFKKNIETNQSRFDLYLKKSN